MKTRWPSPPVVEKYVYALFVLQKCIASHESNGIDIIVDLVKGDIKLMGDEHNDIAMKLKV